MKRYDAFIIIFLLLFYFVLLFAFKRHVFTYNFELNLITRFLHSQSIPHEVAGRIFLSDEDVYIASGYLHAAGNDPTSFVFEHPPLIKYLFGISILLFNNPYWIQIAFGILFIILTYLLGKYAFKKTVISVLACLFLIIDPLFLDVSGQALLDLGQAVFSLAYLIAFLYFPGNIILQGIILGFFASSKFWPAALFFFLVLNFFDFLRNKKVKFKKVFLTLFVTFIVFSMTYLKTFLIKGFSFNIVLFEMKMLKYWFDHSVSTYPFASLILFLSGFFKTWWGEKEIIRSNIYSILWPLLFIISIVQTIRLRKINHKTLVYALPIIYLLYLGVQAPFPRYFIIVLPYFYLSLSSFLFEVFFVRNKYKRGRQD